MNILVTHQKWAGANINVRRYLKTMFNMHTKGESGSDIYPYVTVIVIMVISGLCVSATARL